MQHEENSSGLDWTSFAIWYEAGMYGLYRRTETEKAEVQHYKARTGWFWCCDLADQKAIQQK